MTSRSVSTEKGFSLVELLVAMMVTLIVTGAMWGLIAGGQSAFRREPELTDRQQNVRAAMDLIMRDISNAGTGMPAFMQTFTRGLNACAGCPDGGAPMGLGGQVTDELEIVTLPENRDNQPACGNPGNASPNVRLVLSEGLVPVDVPVMIVMTDGTYTMRYVTDTSSNNTKEGRCEANRHDQLLFNTGQADVTNMNPVGGICSPNNMGFGNAVAGCNPDYLLQPDVVRYRIRDRAGDGFAGPVLERRVLPQPYEVIAVGIEDLQVTYTHMDAAGNNVNGDQPEAVVPNNYATLTTQATVALSARTELFVGGGIGSTDPNVGSVQLPDGTWNATRGQLTSTGSPRGTLIAMTQGAKPSATPYWK